MDKNDCFLDATDQGPLVAWFIVLWIMLKADSASFGIRIAFLLDSIAMQEKPPHLVSLLLSIFLLKSPVTRHSHRR
ncbi:hypothetical protein ACE6H2_003940 [Prunus campanulata]